MVLIDLSFEIMQDNSAASSQATPKTQLRQLTAVSPVCSTSSMLLMNHVVCGATIRSRWNYCESENARQPCCRYEVILVNLYSLCPMPEASYV